MRPPAGTRVAVRDRLGLDADAAAVLRVLPVTVDGATVTCRYDLDELGRFTETFRFDHDVEGVLASPAGPGLRRALGYLAASALVSYHKTVLPGRIELPGAPDTLVDLVRRLVEDGLAEFGYRNEIDVRGATDVVATDGSLVDGVDWEPTGDSPSFPGKTSMNPSEDTGPVRPLVPVGGGVDSAVTLTALAERDPVAFAVNAREPMRATAAAVDRPLATVDRHLDPRLFELNGRGALNGHVPITAIVSGVAIVSALLEGCGSVVFSNERSADEPTLVAATQTGGDWTINHQWSKSWDFERRMRDFVHDHVHPQLTYFSFLRPASSLAIARVFAQRPGLHAPVTSCNRVFRIPTGPAHEDRKPRPETGWCGDCPKCRFVFLALAVFLERSAVVDIFGRDLLDDSGQLTGYRELLDRDGHHKPFECVGEAGESQAAMDTLAADPEWATAAVVTELGEANPDAAKAYLDPGTPGTLPQTFRDDYLATFRSG